MCIASATASVKITVGAAIEIEIRRRRRDCGEIVLPFVQLSHIRVRAAESAHDHQRDAPVQIPGLNRPGDDEPTHEQEDQRMGVGRGRCLEIE